MTSTASPVTTRTLEIVPGKLDSTINKNGVSAVFSVEENGSGVISFTTFQDLTLPSFTASRPNAKLYYDSTGKPPEGEKSFNLYIDNQGMRIVFEDGVLINSVFDQEIVLDVKGYEISGTGSWIGVVTGPGV